MVRKNLKGQPACGLRAEPSAPPVWASPLSRGVRNWATDARTSPKRRSWSYPYLSEIENGTKNPSGQAFDAIAAALDLAPQELQDLETQYEVAEPAEMAAPAGDMFTPILSQSAGPPGKDASVAAVGDVVGALTADVMRQIEPIVQAAIARALDEQP